MNDDREEPACSGDPQLDPLLAAAFGPRGSAENPCSANSNNTIVDALAAIRSSAQRTTLRLHGRRTEIGVHIDAPDQSDARKDSLPTPTGRYVTESEIARGGMGIVYRGQDRDLGRDVAIKVLLDQHAANPSILQRFIEEAQIIGQLQHPGLIQVHELSVGQDGRPFFAMRYVDGETLAVRLQARANPADDQQRFVRIFEQICQTVGYAHTRGVVHRDLKPLNVMVGEFGEVIVIDWGLAKVLGREEPLGSPADSSEELSHRTVATHTRPNIALGTPAYCSPEQAKGDVAATDARTDVFGLGAILCEILTGAPPYRADDYREELAQARAGDLEDVWDRLDACGAASELVQLARRCLASDPSNRPLDGTVVAREVSEYLAAAAERAHTAEVATEVARVSEKSARARARAERRARHLAIMFAGLLLVVLGGGGSTYWWLDRTARERQSTRTKSVQRAIEDAVANHAVARAGGSRTIAAWAEAMASGRRAVALAEEGEVDRDVEVRAKVVLDGVIREETAARGAREQERRNQAFLAAFDEIRNGAGEHLVELIRKRFADWDSNLLELPLGEASQRIERSEIKDALIASLDTWVRMLRGLGTSEAVEEADRIEQVVSSADGDPWRKRFREVTKTSFLLPHTTNHTVTYRLAKEVDVAMQPAFYIRSLATSLPLEDSLTLLLRANQHDPTRLNISLADTLSRFSPPRYTEALRYAGAAVAAHPMRPDTRIEFGTFLLRAGRAAEALDVFRYVELRHPEYYAGQYWSGVAMRRLGEMEEGDRAIAKARQSFKQGVDSRWNLAAKLLECKEIELALAELSEMIRLEPNRAEIVGATAMVYREQGLHSEAVSRFREALRLGNTNPMVRLHLAETLAQLEQTSAAVQELQKAAVELPHNHLVVCALGRRLRLAGRPKKALEAIQRSIEIDGRCLGSFQNLAQVQVQLGNLNEAIAAYRRCLELDAQPGYQKDIAVVLRKAGEPDLAIQEAQQVIDRWPGYPVSWGLLASLHADKREYGKAEAISREALRRFPKLLDAWRNLANALFKTGRRDEAISELEKAVQLSPDDFELRTLLGGHLRTRGELERAIDVLQEALRQAEQHGKECPESHHQLAMAFETALDKERALRHARTAVKLSPNEARFRRVLGFLLYLGGDPAGVVEALKPALDLTGNEKLRMMAVSSLRATGNIQEALQIARAAQHSDDSAGMWRDTISLLETIQIIQLGRRDTLPAPADPVMKLMAKAELNRMRGHAAAQCKLLEEAMELDAAKVFGTLREGARVVFAVALVAAAQRAEAIDARGLRKQACEILGMQLGSLTRASNSQRSVVMFELRHLLWHPGLSTVREPDAIARLATEEQRMWTTLWTRVREAYAKIVR